MVNTISYKLDNIDYASLSGQEQQEVSSLTEDMNRVLELVAAGKFESFVTLEEGLTHLRERAQELGSDLPDSYVAKVMGIAQNVSLERVEHEAKVKQWMSIAEMHLKHSNSSYWRFSDRIHEYSEAHGLSETQIDALDERANNNPFLYEGSQGAPRLASRTADPFK